MNGTRSWVSDCTSFDPHDRFTLRLDSISGSGLFSRRRTRLVHSSCQLAKYRLTQDRRFQASQRIVYVPVRAPDMLRIVPFLCRHIREVW